MNNNIIIFDTTLRDGEQSPGFTMTHTQKIEMAMQLEVLGVDVMEAGFPISSKGDWDAVNAIAKQVKDVTIAGLARAKEGDIDAVVSAIKPANRGRIHTFISTSDLHIHHKLKSTRGDVLDVIKQSVTYARRFCDDVEWSAEDATRTDPDYLCHAVETAIKAGATTINLPDTVGYSMPYDCAAMFNDVANRVPNIDKAILSTHCHNDLGMATANTLSAIHAGARQVECTINGIGERAGNAALEEIVMAIRTRNDVHLFQTNINTQKITETSKLLSAITGMDVQPNKAIVGANAFAHESGIHQHGMLANRATYEVMNPTDVGANSSLVIGKHSGMAAIKVKFSELNVTISDTDLKSVYTQIMEHCDNHSEIDDCGIKRIVKGLTMNLER